MSQTHDKSSYVAAEFDDHAAEIERLRLQAEVVFTREDAALRDLGFPERGHVLDAGCGPGFFAASLRRTRPELAITGIDVDRDALALARSSVRAIEADAKRLPFEAETFDAAYSRLLLRHVPEPEQVVVELARVVRTGGRVFAIDADDGQLVLDPVPDDLFAVRDARHASIRRRGCDPYTARRLGGLFVRAGLCDVQSHGIAISSTLVGREAFARTILGPIAQAIDLDLIEPERLARCREALQAWCRDEAAFAMIVATVVAGEKRD